MKFNELVKTILLEKKAILKYLNTSDIRKLGDSMEGLESEYFDYAYQNDINDILDNSHKSGFECLGVYNDVDMKLKGYIYGYNLQEDDIEELEDMADDPSVEYYDDEYRNMVQNNQIDFHKYFYVDTLVVSKDYRFYTGLLIKSFLNKLKEKGYEYICFYGLEDTVNLFMKGSSFKQSRLSSNNINVVATWGSGSHKAAIFKI